MKVMCGGIESGRPCLTRNDQNGTTPTQLRNTFWESDIGKRSHPTPPQE